MIMPPSQRLERDARGHPRIMLDLGMLWHDIRGSASMMLPRRRLEPDTRGHPSIMLDPKMP